uniref:F-box domain-containing protein n=1 Tax=Brassica campestris TaxID=3711 RepID=M4D0Y4_BRACM
MKKRGKENQKSLRKGHQGGEKLPQSINVPYDLAVEILSRLPVKTLARLRCVSKLWSSSIITEAIKTRALTQPRQLVVCYHRSIQSSYISSYTYPLNANTTFVAADRGGLAMSPPCRTLYQRRSTFDYAYVRGLIFYYSDSKQFAIYNPTTSQNVLLPRTVGYHKENKSFDGFSRYDPVANVAESKYYHGFFGYDPVKDQYKVLRFIKGATICDYSCMVITFRGPNKQEWRKIEIQEDIAPPRGNGVCINGIIYYLGGTLTSSVLVLGRFDVRFERFDHIQMPIDVEMNQLEELSLVNYQGKLGCTFYSKDRAEVWVMKDHGGEKHEWSKVTIDMSLPDMLKTLVAGVTLDGEIVIMPKTLDSAQTLLYAYFYNPKENKTRRVEFETNLKGELEVCIFSEPDHMENATSLLGSQFNRKKTKKKKRKKTKKSATTTVFSYNKIFLCPKKLLVNSIFMCRSRSSDNIPNMAYIFGGLVPLLVFFSLFFIAAFFFL